MGDMGGGGLRPGPVVAIVAVESGPGSVVPGSCLRFGGPTGRSQGPPDGGRSSSSGTPRVVGETRRPPGLERRQRMMVESTVRPGGGPTTKDAADPLVVAVCGWSGSGKTTLIEALIPRLSTRALAVPYYGPSCDATTWCSWRVTKIRRSPKYGWPRRATTGRRRRTSSTTAGTTSTRGTTWRCWKRGEL